MLAAAQGVPQLPFDHFVILNLARGGDGAPLPPSTPDVPDEILFFPFIVLELVTENGQLGVRVYDQQHMPVKPEWHTVDQNFAYAASLAQCIRKFDAYVYAQFTQKNKSFCLVTDGPEDLVYTLRKECIIKRIRLPAYFDRFFDLRKEFNKFYPEYGAKTLSDMAQCLGVVRKADATGMDRCKVISNIIASVLLEGYCFAEPEVIPVTFDPFVVGYGMNPHQLALQQQHLMLQQQLHHQQQQQHLLHQQPPQHASQVHAQHHQQPAQHFAAAAPVKATAPLSYKSAVAGGPAAGGGRSAGGSGSGGGGGGGGAAAAASAAGHSSSGDDGAESGFVTKVVRLRGLPWDAKDDQLREFFSGLAMSDVLWTFTHRNRPSGEAYVTFASVGDAKKALGRDKQMLGKRYIEVFASSPEQAEAARDHRKMEFTKGDGGGHADDDAARETLLCMYGLPYQVTAAEVEGFFGGYGFVAGSVVLDVDASGKPQGTGQIRFSSHREAVRALHDRHRKFIGRRYVNLHFPNRKGMPPPPLPAE